MERLRLKRAKLKQRKGRIRKKISGTSECPRLSVYRSNRFLYVQAIDDLQGETLASTSTVGKESGLPSKKDKATGEALGKLIGDRLKEINVKSVVFDRNGNKFHGVIKAIADGVRSTGLEF